MSSARAKMASRCHRGRLGSLDAPGNFIHDSTVGLVTRHPHARRRRAISAAGFPVDRIKRASAKGSGSMPHGYPGPSNRAMKKTSCRPLTPALPPYYSRGMETNHSRIHPRIRAYRKLATREYVARISPRGWCRKWRATAPVLARMWIGAYATAGTQHLPTLPIRVRR